MLGFVLTEEYIFFFSFVFCQKRTKTNYIPGIGIATKHLQWLSNGPPVTGYVLLCTILHVWLCTPCVASSTRIRNAMLLLWCSFVFFAVPWQQNKIFQLGCSFVHLFICSFVHFPPISALQLRSAAYASELRHTRSQRVEPKPCHHADQWMGDFANGGGGDNG